MTLLQLALLVVLLLAAAAFSIWMIKECLTKTCPHCQEDEESDALPLPIIPGYLWYCLACSKTSRQSELIERQPGRSSAD